VPKNEAAVAAIVADQPWTVQEVAAFLREHPRTVRRRIARGELPVIRLPGSRRLLFDQATVRGFVAANTTR